MGLFIFLTIVQAIVAATLVILVLMQRSEGGGLGIGGGGSPGGFMSARGAADLLTRATKWSAVIFVILAIVLAGLAVDVSGTRDLDQSLDRSISAPVEDADPLAGAAGNTAAPAAEAAETGETAGPADPLAGAAE